MIFKIVDLSPKKTLYSLFLKPECANKGMTKGLLCLGKAIPLN